MNEDLFAAARAEARSGPEFCERCSSKGWLLCERAYHGERSEFWKETCPDCHGSGKNLLGGAADATVQAAGA